MAARLPASPPLPDEAMTTGKTDARRLSTEEQRARNRLVVKRCYYRKIVRWVLGTSP